jgi:hypothetical protein
MLRSPCSIDRLLINTFVTFAYFGFWNVSLYVWGFGQRKFNPNGNPTLGRQLHNMFYSVCGVAQWTVWEVCFVYAYATGRLGYVSDADAFSCWQEGARTIAAILFVPLWRDFHFYFAHRFLVSMRLFLTVGVVGADVVDDDND